MNATYIRLLKNRNFAIFLSGQILSVFSDSLFKISLMWYVAGMADAMSSVAAVLFVSYLPRLIVGIWGGYLIDQFNRKHMMILNDCLSGAALVILMLVMQATGLDLWLLLGVRFFLSLMDVFYSPAASAYIPTIVAKEDLIGANSLFSVVYNALDIISAGLAGIAVAAMGFDKILCINAALYAVSAGLIAFLPASKQERRGEKANWSELTRGYREIFTDRFLRQFVAIVFTTNILYTIAYGLVAVYTQSSLHVGSEGYGFLQSTISIGMLVGSALVGVLKIRHPGKMMIWGLLFQGAVLLVIGINSSLFLAVVCFFLFALSDALAIPLFSYLQIYVADAIKGRVLTAFDTMVLLASPIASVLIECLSKSGDAMKIYLCCGCIMGLLFVGFLNARALKRVEI